MDAQQLAEILNACLMRGFEPPLYVCAISGNGAFIVVRYERKNDDQFSMEALAEHYPDRGFLLPINMMISSAFGEAVRVVIRQPEQWSFADLN